MTIKIEDKRKEIKGVTFSYISIGELFVLDENCSRIFLKTDGNLAEMNCFSFMDKNQYRFAKDLIVYPVNGLLTIKRAGV